MPRVAQDTPLSDVIVDDSQTDQIQYISGPSTADSDGKWTHTSNIEEDFYYQGTLSSCSTQECRMQFSFKGMLHALHLRPSPLPFVNQEPSRLHHDA